MQIKSKDDLASSITRHFAIFSYTSLIISQELYIDEKNQIITTPAYMCETKLHEVHDGVAKLVRAVIHLSKKDKE